MAPPPHLPTPARDPRAQEKQVLASASALDLEFEQLWETTSDLGADDLGRMKQYVGSLKGWNCLLMITAQGYDGDTS